MSSSGGCSSSEGEWEDVESLHPLRGSETKNGEGSQVTAVEIVLPAKGSICKGKKKNALEKAMEAFDRELRHNLHKTSLLCLLAQGIAMDTATCDPLLQARLFSLVPRELHLGAAGKLYKLLKWFVARKDSISTALKENGEKEQEKDSLSSVQQFVAVLKVLGLRTRLVLALNPISFRPSREKNTELLTSQDMESSTTAAEYSRKPLDAITKSPVAGPHIEDNTLPPQPGPHFFRLMEQLKQNACRDAGSEANTTKTEDGGEGGRGVRGKRRSSESAEGGPGKRRKLSFGDSVSPAKNSNKTPPNRTGVTRTPGSKKKGKQKKENRTPTTASETSPYFSSQGKGSCGTECGDGSESDSDFIPLKRKAKRLSFASSSDGSEGGEREGGGVKKGERKRRKGKAPKGAPQKSQNVSRKIDKMTSPENSSQPGVYDETCSWAEVYQEDKGRFVSLHLPSCSVDQPKMCEKHCPHKLSYVLAFENREGGGTVVVDVTGRYASEWCTSTRRLRLRDSWWSESLSPFSPSHEEREREEEDIMNILYSHPLPTSTNDYKSHPLYALRRHLLKFEAIYPVDSKILGYCRGEPIFSRDCVFTLHTRETWLKEGRVVKKDEEPYKVVKARPKKGQSSLERDTSTVEVFGHWQTEVYVPPPVVDGVVPRNEYGNVELFQPSMLPAGACHIRIAGIYKVARKLGVSYAPAMIGWDFHSGHCCPVIDGVVVAEENQELLMEAWRQEEQMMIEKGMKKREARVLERWRKMARGVLIRERVQRTYSLT